MENDGTRIQWLEVNMNSNFWLSDVRSRMVRLRVVYADKLIREARLPNVVQKARLQEPEESNSSIADRHQTTAPVHQGLGSDVRIPSPPGTR
jgi:hypothetical protein